MIIREFYRTRDDGVDLYITYSSNNFKIKQCETNNVYDVAIDVLDSKYTYIETEVLLEDVNGKFE